MSASKTQRSSTKLFQLHSNMQLSKQFDPNRPHTFQLVVTPFNNLQDFTIALLDECPS